MNPLVELGSVADVNWGDTSTTKSSYIGEGYVAFSAAGPDGFLPYADHDREAIVLSAIGARCGRTWFAQGQWSCIKNTIRFWSVTPKLDNKYLYWVTNNENFFPKRGAAQPFITIGDARRTVIPLPPLDEQKRIAAILDKADALRRKRRQALALLESLTQSIFLEMFGDLTVCADRRLRCVALSEVAEISSGITKGRKTSSSEMVAVPYLAVANVQDKILNLDSVKTIEATRTEVDKFRLKFNDLLLTEGGDPDKLGRGTIWRDELPLAIHQNHIFRVRITSSIVDPLYANWLIGSAYGKKYFLKSAKQTTGIASINKSQLSVFPMVLPPIGLQRIFAKRVNSVSAHERAQMAHLNGLDSCFSALQTRAFGGGI